MIIVNTPGKLILSGEHAVLYGAPACAIAVNKTIQGQYSSHHHDEIHIHCPDLAISETLSCDALFALHEKLRKKYHDFTLGHLSIDQVIKKPIELCWFTIASTLKEVIKKNQHSPAGIKIVLHSTIPLGCGMGSSAALIINIILGINALFNLGLSQKKILEQALLAENLQHGYSSGLDIQLSLMGGIHLFRKTNDILTQHHEASQTRLHLPFQYMNSGKPESSTGECVAFVKQQAFPKTVWNEFEKTTLTLIRALHDNNLSQIIESIKKNHRLLCHIGVVPLAIQAIIADIESQGGAAKICGAGSIRGDNAGIILMTNTIHWPNITPLIQNHDGAHVNHINAEQHT